MHSALRQQIEGRGGQLGANVLWLSYSNYSKPQQEICSMAGYAQEFQASDMHNNPAQTRTLPTNKACTDDSYGLSWAHSLVRKAT